MFQDVPNLKSAFTKYKLFYADMNGYEIYSGEK